jgi:hypothetical protein
VKKKNVTVYVDTGLVKLAMTCMTCFFLLPLSLQPLMLELVLWSPAEPESE